MSKRKRNRPKRRMKQGCHLALAVTDEMRELARADGIQVQVNRVMCRSRTATLHVIFRDEEGAELLHYWPGTGKVWCAFTADKRVVENMYEALCMARAMRQELGHMVEEAVKR